MSSPIAAPLSPEYELANNLRTFIARVLREYTIERLVRESEIGQRYSFVEASTAIQSVRELLDQLAQRELHRLPLGKIMEIHRAIGSVVEICQAIRNYAPDVHGSMAVQERDQLIGTLRSRNESLFNVCAPALSYLAFDSDLLKRSQKDAEEIVSSLGRERLKILEARQEIESLLGSARETAAKVGVVKHASDFSDEARRHKYIGWCWLAATALLAILVVTFGVWNYSVAEDALHYSVMFGRQSSPDVPFSLTLQISIAKVIIFSVLLSAVFWAGRVYKAHRHNYVVNMHRVNALKSFQTFAKAADEDQQIKNAVLLQATECIYRPQATGFVVSHDAEFENPSKVLEIFRDFSGRT